MRRLVRIPCAEWALIPPGQTEVSGLVAAATDSAALDAAAKRQVAAVGVLGQLQAMMDEIDIGEIEDDEARSAAALWY